MWIGFIIDLCYDSRKFIEIQFLWFAYGLNGGLSNRCVHWIMPIVYENIKLIANWNNSIWFHWSTVFQVTTRSPWTRLNSIIMILKKCVKIFRLGSHWLFWGFHSFSILIGKISHCYEENGSENQCFINMTPQLYYSSVLHRHTSEEINWNVINCDSQFVRVYIIPMCVINTC